MARSKKASAMNHVDDDATMVVVASPANQSDILEGPESSSQVKEDLCPSCIIEDGNNHLNSMEKERWIRCDACKVWYHWRCVGQGDDLDSINKWFCQSCIAKKPSLMITRKAPTRKSSRKRTRRDYVQLDSGTRFDSTHWVKTLEEKVTNGNTFKRMHGNELRIGWVETDETAMREPIIIEKPDSLEMNMPPSTLTVRDVVELVGGDTMLEVIDVATQTTSHGWTLQKWAEYMELEPERREKILNVISLEVSGTKLGDMISPPQLVRELDWVENFWPSTRKGKGHAYPKVQLYCLMGVASAWTDWHIDFAGSSVYYHILRGSKIFYFIRPTQANLGAYERWSGTELQYQSWLGDMVDDVYKVELREGNTMIIPSGWIHAVYTPVDTIVLGGNFLHSYSVPTQLRVRDIEISTQVPKKFRFPMFSRLCWYVGDKYLRDIKARPEIEFSTRLLSSLISLANFLVSEARLLERGSETQKKEIKEQIPTDRIKDAPALARELRWRLRNCAGLFSEDEGARSVEQATNEHLTNGVKRKRGDREGFDDSKPQFRNFKPRVWDRVVETVEESGERATKLEAPSDQDNWSEPWLRPNMVEMIEGQEEGLVVYRRSVAIKVRRTARGLERQHIERSVEQWSWDTKE